LSDGIGDGHATVEATEFDEAVQVGRADAVGIFVL